MLIPSSHSTLSLFPIKTEQERAQNRIKKTLKKMCTRWTLTRFVRWRVRDLASCFMACRFPLEEEPELPIRNMVFETEDETRDKNINKRLSRRNRRHKDRQPNQSSSMSRNTECFSDEEYIVFCIREDGAFEIVKDNGKSQESSRSSEPANRKVNYAEDAERVKHSSDDGRSNEDEYEGEILPAEEGTGGERSSSICMEVVELASGRSRRRYQGEETPTANRGTFSVESSDSNQSDGSTGSFAFPVLGWEWTGSPVQMPKSESLSTKKNKALSVRFQCFRF